MVFGAPIFEKKSSAKNGTALIVFTAYMIKDAGQ
jgi:hypothetical protein